MGLELTIDDITFVIMSVPSFVWLLLTLFILLVIHQNLYKLLKATKDFQHKTK